MIPASTFDTVAQLSHFGWGALIVTAPLAAGMPLRNLLWVLAGFLALTAWKEFWFDFHHETPDVRGSSLKDFVFYQLGASFGVGLVLFAHWKGWTA